MDMNQEAREAMNRWRTRQKTAERRVINFNERVGLRLDEIRDRMVTHRVPLLDWEIREVYYRDVDEYEPIDMDWRPMRVGEPWGGPDVSAFFRRTVTIPPEMDGRRVFLRIYVGGDSLLRLDGVPYHGLDPFREQVLIAEQAVGGAIHDIELESYVFWYPAEGDWNIFREAELVAIDAEVEAAYWDFVATFKVMLMPDIEPNLKNFLENHIWEALRALPNQEPDFDVFKRVLNERQDYLRRYVFNTDRFKVAGLLYAVGHSHLDIVYQWPHREYIRKVGRTHATMLRMIEQYPDFKFSQSSAKIYADMKEHFPGLYAQVKAQIKAGRWQPVGAFWLEPDCNLISGESLVRHILHGQRFWQAEFGFQSKVCWQPDVFGMSWVLPQILQRSGIDVVVTNKLFVWNDTNKWTQNVFWWESIDGSRVLGVIPPGHFIGFMDPDHIDGYWKAYSNKDDVGEMIYTYGWGDGGGGVDPEMIECAMRYQDFPGIVPLQFSNPEDALLQIYDKASGEQIPTWRDELYLETHRGTYTSKGALKKHNRRSEIILQQVETLAALAWADGAAYPEAELDAAWKILLNTQFHDALPGTHITEVYHYLLDEYQRLYDHAEAIRDGVTASLFGDTGGNVLLFNPSTVARAGVVSLPTDILHNGAGQFVDNIDGTSALLVQLGEPLPGVSARVLSLGISSDGVPDTALTVTERTLENVHLRAEFTAGGELISLWDKAAGREVLVEGLHGNHFQMYEDRPGRYEAWDIISSYVEHDLPMTGDATLTVDECGPLRASLRLVRTFADSKITQRISLLANGQALTFETEIEWHERQRLLKVGFPVGVNAQQATYDIAYGTIQRATHRNTAHDQARFEVPAHWWMDLSEYGYGVALLNDSKYGHEAHHQWMYLTLLKGSILPDPEADLGTHHFTYALYPHTGDWREGDVIGAATALNVPLYARPTARGVSETTFVSCDAPNVTLEAVKRAEDGRRLILRLVERYNKRTQATVTLHKPVGGAFRCDLMEREEAQIPVDGNTVSLMLQPCEIVTLAIVF